MPLYTVVLRSMQSLWVTQHRCETPENAVAQAVGRLPADDGDDPTELEWLHEVARGRPIELEALTDLEKVWLWMEGAQRTSRTVAHVITTHATGRPDGGP